MSIEKSGPLKYGLASKVFIPVLAGLTFQLVLYSINLLFNPLDTDRDGAMTLAWQTSYIILPALFLLLALAQWFVVTVIWNRIILKRRQLLKSAMFTAFLISLTIGLPGGILISVRRFGFADMIFSVFIISGLQLFYWIVNFCVLYLLDRSYSGKINGAATVR